MNEELTWEEANPEPEEPSPNVLVPTVPGWFKPPIGLISAHFSWRESRCKHCGMVPSGVAIRETARWLERIRAEVLNDRPMKINSWARCPTHNAAVGGVVGSTHTLGWAVDCTVLGLTVQETQTLLIAHQGDGKLIGGLGVYRTWTHIDRGAPRRWTGPKIG